jgi:hypothetical protein
LGRLSQPTTNSAPPVERTRDEVEPESQIRAEKIVAAELAQP